MATATVHLPRNVTHLGWFSFFLSHFFEKKKKKKKSTIQFELNYIESPISLYLSLVSIITLTQSSLSSPNVNVLVVTYHFDCNGIDTESSQSYSENSESNTTVPLCIVSYRIVLCMTHMT